MLIQTNITFNQFCDTFRAMGRNEQFTYEAKRALYDHLNEDDQEIELDVIALCCDFSEYSDIGDYNEQNMTEFKSWDELDSIVIPFGHDSAICANV